MKNRLPKWVTSPCVLVSLCSLIHHTTPKKGVKTPKEYATSAISQKQSQLFVFCFSFPLHEIIWLYVGDYPAKRAYGNALTKPKKFSYVVGY